MVVLANNQVDNLQTHSKPKCLFKSGDAILSFNYTSTLEKLFAVPSDVPLLHIHGFYEFGKNLIFGYRANNDSYFEEWSSLDEDNWDFYIEKQRETVYEFYKNWQKELQISKFTAFMSKCSEINKIVVLGHSMSVVDYDYMQHIENFLRPKAWNISYYKEEDIERISSLNYSFSERIAFFPIEALI